MAIRQPTICFNQPPVYIFKICQIVTGLLAQIFETTDVCEYSRESSVTLTKTRLYFIVEVFRPIVVIKKVEMGLNTQKRQRQDKRHTLNIIRLGQVKHKNHVIT